MVNVPSNLRSLLPRIRRADYLQAVEEIVFSGPTYQLKVVDPKTSEDYWTFLQFNASGELADAFCSCEGNEGGGCLHLALSYLRIFDGKKTPLHVRFHDSFWRAIGQVWMRRYGEKLRGVGWKGISLSEVGDKILGIISEKKAPENEENSIKFSNLEEEELDAWREGKPSEALLFELSRWGDLAKQLMIYDESHPVSLYFPEEAQGLPLNLEIKSPDFEIQSALDPSDWLLLMPSLNTVTSNLKGFNRLKDQYKAITFEKEVLKFVKKKVSEHQGVKIGEWIYVKGEGFYPTDVPSFTVLKGDEIPSFLDHYTDELKDLLTGTDLHFDSIGVRYLIDFDSNWNLHIDPYILKPGDFKQRWNNWVFVPGSGFYKLKSSSLIDLPSQIAQEDIPSFIQLHASWLNEQRGFEVHLGALETRITYSVDPSGTLSFEKKVVSDASGAHEFDDWVYFKGEGFFHKSNSHASLPIDFDIPVRRDVVSHFIRRNAKELSLVPNFFADEGPFENVGLEVHLGKKEEIWLEPHFDLKSKFSKLTVQYFDEWIYLEGVGFSELQSDQRLPERLREPVWVASGDVKAFIEKELPGLKPWIRSLDPRLIPPFSLRVYLDHLEEAPYHSWFLQIHYQTEHGPIPFKDIFEAIKKKKAFLFSPHGLIDLSDDHFLWIKRLKPESIKDGILHLSTIELLRLHAFEDMIARGDTQALFQEVMDLKKIPEFNCTELQSVLRPYQDKGARWLFSLYFYLMGGMLCDEMGLGKTHQSMALMAAVRTITPNAKFLVVCPTSVLYHWEDRLKEFFPTLNVTTFHGPFRDKALDQDFSLMLTSYGVLRKEVKWFQQINFDLAVYDEIQVAKNHRSKLHSALEQIKANVKLGLTGTPIENKLRELKTLFDIVLPGYMPQESDYFRLIVKPIEKQRDLKQKNLLQRLIHPFILRRTKSEVLTDLPSKTEEIAHCDLSPSQERLYREVLLMQRDELIKEIFDSKKGVPYLHVFALLSRLKQICDHPALYYKKTEEYQHYHSGKWELFVELLQEARESNQKVVVYSQYLGMLDIIEAYLKNEGIGFASLRGSTRDRKEQVTLFAEDPTCSVFVASLKAAGLGIDLTAGSVVIHYDRWWNAARENQATDRVHRIGQSRGVQVFKLVTKNTFEERIHQIIEQKKELMEGTILADDHEVIKSFTREELFQLLQFNP